MSVARSASAALALVALLAVIAALAGHADGFSLGADKVEYAVGDRPHVVADGTELPVTFQVVWGQTTLVVIVAPPINGSCALDFTLPAEVLGTVQVHAASPDDNRSISFEVVRRGDDGGGHGGFVLPDVPLVPLMVATVVAVAAVLGGMWSVETTRWYLLALPAIAAGAMRREEGPSQRERIRRLILDRYNTQRRGTRQPLIMLTLGIATGTVVYHLRKLQKGRQVYALSYDRKLFFFPDCAPYEETRRQLPIIEWTPSHTHLAIMRYLDAMPGSTLGQIGSRVSKVPGAAERGVRLLVERGWVVETGKDPATYDIVRTPKSYRCSVCGYALTSNIPPRVCPLCERAFIDYAS